MRIERDSLGERELPNDAYYGIQTLRAMENFAVSSDTFIQYPNIIRAMIEVKKACALTNRDIGALPGLIADAVLTACDEILDGKHGDQFPINVFRGCGTSINMNANEVLGNRANEILTGHKGTDLVHPNTHVNMCQSSNDVFPTAAAIVLHRESGALLSAVVELEDALAARSRETKDIVRIGRTCLQDAVPLTFGQGLSGCAALVERCRKNLAAHQKRPVIGLLGATAVGTGIGLQPGFLKNIYRNLSAVAGFSIRPAANFFDGMQNADGYMALSALVRNIAAAGRKIAGDFMLLASGPAFGIAELALDEAPGNLNFVPGGMHVCKLMRQIACQVNANDAAICMAASRGEPDIASPGGIKLISLLESLELAHYGVSLFADACVRRFVPATARARSHAEQSLSLAAMASALRGYEVGSRIAQAAGQNGRTCKEAAVAENIFSRAAAEEIFNARSLTERSVMERLIRKYRDL